jgi:hypothetical protein
MFRAFLLSVALVALFACGCTTAPGSTGVIAVVTTPAGAAIYLDGSLQGTSPLNITANAGSHSVELRFPDGYTWSTPIIVPGGAVSHIEVVAPEITPIETRVPLITPAPPQGLILTNLMGYQGGGDYLTRLSFNLALAPGDGPIDLSKAIFELRTPGASVTPYWEITKRQYVTTGTVLTPGDVFTVTVSTPRIDAGEMFTLEIRPEEQDPLIITRQVPSPVGISTPL